MQTMQQMQNANLRYVIFNCWDRLPQKRAVSTRTCRGEAPPSCCARPFCHSNTPLGCLLLRKRELLRTRHFRQDARKSDGNFSKKREGWTVPALLTRQQPKSFIPTLKPSSSRFRPGLQNALAIRKKPCYNAAVIESEIFRAGCDSLPVVQPTSRKA